MVKHDVIDVGVRQQMLWIGSDAYPLKGITRVSSHTWVPRRGLAVWRFAKSVAGMWFTGVLVLVVLSVVVSVQVDGMPGLDLIPVLVLLGLVAATAVKAVRLASWLRSSFHMLDVETASSSTTALSSRDPSVVRELVGRITHAINHPMAEFQMRVDNFHLGDVITQHGADSRVYK
ncbi:DUF6232 family protein [Lentzea sp. NPDC058450]|uniref:DUF6232 family protein n=1 Tax=Lentzea sp. NPDC058450 TaxID=3346505 RepID=UPI0036642753